MKWRQRQYVGRREQMSTPGMISSNWPSPCKRSAHRRGSFRQRQLVGEDCIQRTCEILRCRLLPCVPPPPTAVESRGQPLPGAPPDLTGQPGQTHPATSRPQARLRSLGGSMHGGELQGLTSYRMWFVMISRLLVPTSTLIYRVPRPSARLRPS